MNHKESPTDQMDHICLGLGCNEPVDRAGNLCESCDWQYRVQRRLLQHACESLQDALPF